MRVLVTGAAGFSGRWIARKLLSAGCEVVAHSRRTPLPDDLAAAPRVTAWTADLAVQQRLPAGIDAVVHAAATSPPTGSADAVAGAALVRDNALATALLVEAACAAGIGRFVYLSSLSVHGSVDGPVLDATTPIRDPNPYGASKFMGERVLAASGLAGLAIRLPAVIGTGADRNWPVQVVGQLRRREVVRVYNADGPFNNVVHVADLAGWIAAVLSDGGPEAGFAAVPVASTVAISVRDAVAALAAGLGVPAGLEAVSAPRGAFVIDSSAAGAIGFRPSATVDALTRYARAPD